MINVVDIIIIVILLLAFLDGYRKGFLASVSNLVCTIIALVAAKFYFLQGASFLATYTPLDEQVLSFVRKSTVVENMIKANLPMLDKMGLSQSFAGDMKAFASALIFNAIAFLIVFVIVRLLLGIIEVILSSVMKAPGLKDINALFGSVISVAKAGLFLMIICSVIVPVTSIINKPGIMAAINESVIITYLNQYNFVLGWLWKAVLGVIS